MMEVSREVLVNTPGLKALGSPRVSDQMRIRFFPIRLGQNFSCGINLPVGNSSNGGVAVFGNPHPKIPERFGVRKYSVIWAQILVVSLVVYLFAGDFL